MEKMMGMMGKVMAAQEKLAKFATDPKVQAAQKKFEEAFKGAM